MTKVVILAGGLGTRLAEETHLRPKPMIEIGGKPILWHIMKTYSAYGLHEFIICLGYKGYVIKEYFSNYFLHMSDITFDMQNNRMCVHNKNAEPWHVTLIDTYENTMTGGRLKRVAEYLEDDDLFCFTYGDGVADVNINQLIEFHRQHGKLATMTGTRPPARFGAVKYSGTEVISFQEKPDNHDGWINGGYFVLSPRVIEYIDGDDSIWEREPLQCLARDKQLQLFLHDGFWQPMDTLREKQYLEKLWQENQAPWKVW